jgi:hypothetical protein
MFTGIDDDGNEFWDNVAIEYSKVQPETEQSKWKRIMGWPASVPDSAVTIEAVTKHVRWANAVLHAEVYFAIQQARAEAAQPVGAPIRVPGADTPAEPGIAPRTAPKGYRTV